MTETAKPLGSLLPGIVDQDLPPMAYPPPSTTPLTDLDLETLPKRLDDTTLALVMELSDSPLPAPQTCDDEHFAKCMKCLDILPRRRDDELTGKVKFGIYARHLRSFPNEALTYLAHEATKTCQWFPTPADCLKILRAYPNRDVAKTRRTRARLLVEQELQARIGEARQALNDQVMGQDQIDALPDRWKSQFECETLLWRWPDGRYTARTPRHVVDAMQPDELEAMQASNRKMFEQWEQMAAGIAANKAGAE